MLASVSVLLTLAASAFAYSVTSPSNSSGWTTSGPNVVSWTKVSTDPSNFTIVLNNQQTYPEYNQVLDALAIGSDGSVTVNPPSGGWVAGSGYRVNLVADATHLSQILTQSDMFTITASSSSSTFSSGSSSASSSTGSVSTTSSGSSASTTDTASTTATGISSSGSLNPSSSDTSTSPTKSSAAQLGMGKQASLLGFGALLGMAIF